MALWAELFIRLRKNKVVGRLIDLRCGGGWRVHLPPGGFRSEACMRGTIATATVRGCHRHQLDSPSRSQVVQVGLVSADGTPREPCNKDVKRTLLNDTRRGQPSHDLLELGSQALALWRAARRSPFQLTQRLRLATEHPTLNSPSTTAMSVGAGVPDGLKPIDLR